jgi:NAD(P)-dependent dehydrogenase (short-subunit alcohol dehydrogenase family)
MSKIIVTGSSGLIGRELVKSLSENNTVYVADLASGIDFTDEHCTRKFFSSIKAHYLVNCFALNQHITTGETPTLFDVSMESFRDYMEVNVVALFSVCREFARQKISRGIVNFSSTYGIVSPRKELYEGEKHIGYSVSKAAVVMLTKHLATHLAPRVRVNCIAPGGILNDQGVAFVSKYSNQTPMKRMMGKPELNGIVSYLCSDDSSYVTGSVFVIDGGWTSW